MLEPLPSSLSLPKSLPSSHQAETARQEGKVPQEGVAQALQGVMEPQEEMAPQGVAARHRRSTRSTDSVLFEHLCGYSVA